MYEAYCTYVDDEYVDNHDYDDDTDDDTDNDTGDDTCLLYTSPSPRD